VYFDGKAKSRIQKIVERQAYRAMERQLNAYAVLALDGAVVTVGRREKRIPRWGPPHRRSTGFSR
jgi:hypothetical protein